MDYACTISIILQVIYLYVWDTIYIKISSVLHIWLCDCVSNLLQLQLWIWIQQEKKPVVASPHL